MAEKVDQDVREAAAALIEAYWAGSDSSMLKLAASYRAGHGQGVFVRAFAAMKAAGRQQGLREAAEVDQGAANALLRVDAVLYRDQARALRSAASEITALIEGEGK